MTEIKKVTPKIAKNHVLSLRRHWNSIHYFMEVSRGITRNGRNNLNQELLCISTFKFNFQLFYFCCGILRRTIISYEFSRRFLIKIPLADRRPASYGFMASLSGFQPLFRISAKIRYKKIYGN